MMDPIADMLTQIRNALSVGKPDVTLPYSKFKHQLGQTMVAQGLLEDAFIVARPKQKLLGLKFKYASGKPVVSGLKRISTPGQRIYSKASDVPRTQSGYGVTIISTSKGLLTDKQARKENLGGEIVCQIW